MILYVAGNRLDARRSKELNAQAEALKGTIAKLLELMSGT
jgi:hypothetical protein